MLKPPGYCNSAGSAGDLCGLPELAACKDATSDGYLDATCDEACAQQRCSDEPKCVGYTTNVKTKQYKLKSRLSSTVDKAGYTCHRKDNMDWLQVILSLVMLQILSGFESGASEPIC